MDFIIKFSPNYRDCFCRLKCPQKLLIDQSILQIRNDNGLTSFVTCKEVSYSESSSEVTINGLYGYKNHLHHDSKVIISVVSDHPTLLSDVCVEPETMNDWELIEMHSKFIENNLLQQVRSVAPGMLIPIWVDEICMFLEIKSLSPAAPFGLLTVSSQVHIIPKSSSINSNTLSQPSNSNHHEHIRKQNLSVSDKEPITSSKTSTSLLQSDSIKSNFWIRFLRLLDFLYSIIYRKSFSVYRRQQSLMRSLSEAYSSSEKSHVARVICLDKLVKSEALQLSPMSQVDLFHSSVALLLVNPNSSIADRTSIIVQVKTLHPPASQTKSDTSGIFMLAKVSITSKVPLNCQLILGVSELIMSRSDLKIADRVLLIPQSNNFQICSNLKLSVEDQSKRHVCVYETAFRNFVQKTCSPESPLLVYENMPLSISLDAEQAVTMEISIQNKSDQKSQFYLLTSLLLEGVRIEMSNKSVAAASNRVVSSPPNYIGFESTLKQMIKFSESFLHSNKPASILLLGSEASGKSKLLERLTHHFENDSFIQAHTRIISCKSLIGKQVESIRRHLDSVLMLSLWHCPSVVCLDDIDALAPKSPEVTTNPQEELLQELIAETLRNAILKVKRSGCPIIVAATAKSIQHLHSRLGFGNGCCLFDNHVEIEALDKTARSNLLQDLTTRRLQSVTERIIRCNLSQHEFQYLGDVTSCYVVGDLERLVNHTFSSWITQHALQLVSGGDGPDDRKIELSLSHFKFTLKSFQPLAFNELQDNHFLEKFSLDDIGGLEEAKTVLIETFVWPVKYPNLFAQSPIKLQHGALLYGPPGCGKTLIALALAKESNMNLLLVKGPELLNKYIGASETAVRELIARARRVAPALIFFDEFDSLAPRRGHDSTGVTDRVVNQLLTELDGVDSLGEVFIIATSNRPDLIDPALLRPGRIQMKIYCPLPDQSTRGEILQRMNDPKSVHRCLPLCESVDISELAKVTENFTSADLLGLLNRAGIEAMRRMGLFTAGWEESQQRSVANEIGSDHVTPADISIKPEDIEFSLRTVRPSLKPKELEQYLKIYEQFQSLSTTNKLRESSSSSQNVIANKATLN